VAAADRAADPTVVAVVGLGYWGPNIVRVLHDFEDVEVRYLCDLDASRLDRLGRRYPSASLTTSFDEVLADPDVEAVCLATPVFTHHDLAGKALQAGKHVLVEKPLAPSRAMAEELIELADERDRVLMCGHTFLYSPPVRSVKQLIDDGELGDLFFISSSRVNLGLHQRDISVIWDLGPHDFSILLYWLGEMPTTVSAVGRDSIVAGLPDVAFINLTFASGLIAHVELSWLAPSKLRRTAVVGNRKMVVYDDSSGEPVRLFDHGVLYRDPETFGEYQLSYRTGDIISPKLDASEPLSLELADFLAQVRDGIPNRDQLEIAANVTALAEATDESLASGAPVTVRPLQVSGAGRS
jgi:predicted dehydrogenase